MLLDLIQQSTAMLDITYLTLLVNQVRQARVLLDIVKHVEIVTEQVLVQARHVLMETSMDVLLEAIALLEVAALQS